jgi:cation diffusion facilitator CzcD-associated flavoprotein CzcO
MEHERFDVAVIGAGQAGLAIGYFLRRQGRRATSLDLLDLLTALDRAASA